MFTTNKSVKMGSNSDAIVTCDGVKAAIAAATVCVVCVDVGEIQTKNQNNKDSKTKPT